MILEKQDVVYIPFNTSKHIVLSDNRIISGVTPMKGMYLLTEYQLETIKQEYYGIGVKDGQENK